MIDHPLWIWTEEKKLENHFFKLGRVASTCLSQLASLRSRDGDRCALLLSLLSDAERLTSYVNTLMCIDERQPRTSALGTDGVPETSRNITACCCLVLELLWTEVTK